MLKLLAFLSKKKDIEMQTFIEYYEKTHVPLILRLASTPLVYKRRYLRRDDPLNKEDGEAGFDVVTELGFLDRAAFLAWQAQLSAPGAGEQVAADEAKFLDRARTRAYVVEECVTSG